MRRDRDGEPLEEPAELEHRCTGGWLEDDHAGRARPCLVCRPHLARRRPPRALTFAR